MKLEQIINEDFAKLLTNNNYSFELVYFNNGELVINSKKNTDRLVIELNKIFTKVELIPPTNVNTSYILNRIKIQ